jgi:hypothetical protein
MNSTASKQSFRVKSTNYDPTLSLQISDLKARLDASLAENENLKEQILKLN